MEYEIRGMKKIRYIYSSTLNFKLSYNSYASVFRLLLLVILIRVEKIIIHGIGYRNTPITFSVPGFISSFMFIHLDTPSVKNDQPGIGEILVVCNKPGIVDTVTVRGKIRFWVHKT